MKLSPEQTLACMLDNLEELVFPHVVEEHAVSVARCTSILLRNLILRLTDQPTMLAVDNEEKQALASELAVRLASCTPAAVAAFADDFRALAAEPQPGPTDSVAQLTTYNDKFRRLVESFVRTLHANRSALDPADFDHLQSLIRLQLRAQMDRDVALVRGPLGSSTFPY